MNIDERAALRHKVAGWKRNMTVEIRVGELCDVLDALEAKCAAFDALSEAYREKCVELAHVLVELEHAVRGPVGK